MSKRLPYFIFCGGIPCEISLTLIVGSILLMTPLTMPTEPSEIPKSDANDIIFVIRISIKVLEILNT